MQNINRNTMTTEIAAMVMPDPASSIRNGLFGIGFSFVAFSAITFFGMRSYEMVSSAAQLPLAIFAALGIFLMIGAVYMSRRAARRAVEDKAKQGIILREGVKTTAIITYVDRNYHILINNAPVYSIVEYSFTDAKGNLYTARNTHVPTEFVVRRGLTVGGRYRLMYMLDDPKNMHVLQTEFKVE